MRKTRTAKPDKTMVAFRKKVEAIVRIITINRDELRGLVEEYRAILDSTDDAVELLEDALLTLGRL